MRQDRRVSTIPGPDIVCSLISDGVEVAGVPTGTLGRRPMYTVARARVASHEAVHEPVRLLQCVQSAFVTLRLAARMVYPICLARVGWLVLPGKSFAPPPPKFRIDISAKPHPND